MLNFLVPGLTDGGFLMMAGHVVPLDTVSVEIVEDGEAGLGERMLVRPTTGRVRD